MDRGTQNFHWQNWSGSQQARFREFLQPATITELQTIIQQAAASKQRLKFVGSSHSFSAIIADEDAILISLAKLTGIEDIDTQNHTVRVRAGTKLKDLSRELWQAGYAIANLGDIDEQAIAGAIATGTHGTGIQFQNLAGFVDRVDLISPARGLESFDRQSKEFAALVVGSFAFGAVTHYQLKIVPRYHLKLQMFPATLSEFRNQFNKWVYETRNSEVFWFPGTESILVKLTEQTDESPHANRKSEFVSTWLENVAFGMINKVNAKLPRSHPALRQLLQRLLPEATKIDRSYKVYATERHVKFQETEYSLPISQLWTVLNEMRPVVMAGKYPTLFPIEFRFVKGDELYISPSYGAEDRVYIAVHTYYKDKFYRDYFRELEAIFLRHGGRPHWGKMFFADRSKFAAIYPELPLVRELRQTFDPDRLLLTKTLADHVF